MIAIKIKLTRTDAMKLQTLIRLGRYSSVSGFVHMKLLTEPVPRQTIMDFPFESIGVPEKFIKEL